MDTIAPTSLRQSLIRNRRNLALPVIAGIAAVGMATSTSAQTSTQTPAPPSVVNDQKPAPAAVSNPTAPSGAATLPTNAAAAAATAPTAPPGPAPAVFSSDWVGGIKYGLQVEGGITVNTLSPDNNRNFGELFTDLSNRPILNGLTATVSRDVDPKATTTDYGFKLQALYGSDARIIHTLGVFDQLIHDRNQLDIVEADVSVHIPSLFANGLDIKAGIYPTPLGVEVIDPKANPFYSHSYIFNYGLPYKHTGALATAHVSDLVDLYLGVDTGTNTFLAYGAGDNNNRPGGIAGVGLNFMDGKLTVLALTHMGPEDSKRNTPFGNSAMRYYNDVAIVWKTTDKLTLTAEVNYVKEDGFRAEGYGAAGYASYALSDNLTLNGRAEIWRDSTNFFVSTPANYLDYVAAERGTPANLITAAAPTTYSEATIGVTYKIPGLPEKLTTAMFRPEIRYDRSLNGTTPFGDGKHQGRFTFAADLVLGF